MDVELIVFLNSNAKFHAIRLKNGRVLPVTGWLRFNNIRSFFLNKVGGRVTTISPDGK